MSERFSVNVGLRQGCVMPPWLLCDASMREANAKVLGNWLYLLPANCCRFEINQLLFTVRTSLVTDHRNGCV